MKIVRVLDQTVDAIYRIIFILILLIGFYYIYDTVYIFYNSSAARLIANKPGSGQVAEKPLTEDYIAWLTIDDTDIDYPIMQGKDNNAYLNTNPYGEYSLAGSIFLDTRNDPLFKDSYSLVYGHHMSEGYMFGALDKFEDKAYFEAHQTGTIMLKDGGEYNLELFAFVHTDVNNKIIFDPNGSKAVLDSLDSSQIYKKPKNDHIVALSTCLEPGSTKRTIVLGTLEEKGKE